MNYIRPIMVFLAAGFLVWCPQFAAADIKAATVNMNKLLNDYHAAKKELTTLKTERDKYLAARKTRQEKLNELVAEIKEVHAKLLNKDLPKSGRDELNEKQNGMIGQYKSLVKDLKESDAKQINATKLKLSKATRRLLDEFHVVIQTYATDNGYHWVIDTSGLSNSHISPLIYAKNADDITDLVLEILNKGAAAEKVVTPEVKEPSGS